MNTKLEFAFFVLSGITIFFIIFDVVWIVITEKRLKRFFLGKKAKDLEDTIISLETEINKLNKAKENFEKEIALVNTKLRKSIRGLETIRFNPFPDQGSNQSFAIAFMNDEGNGVVMSSLYARDRMSIFAKPIVGGKSAFELSTEEKEVLDKAIK